MWASMPSPIGHALAGIAIAWSVPRQVRLSTAERSSWKLGAICALLAALPDIDLLYMPLHRRATHSIPVALLVTIICIAVTGWVTLRAGARRSGTWRPEASIADHLIARSPIWIGLACGAAWSSHVLLDWLGADASVPYGIQMLWPFSDDWYYSGWDLFPGTERRQPFGARAMWINLKAAVQETALLGSVALAVWLARTRTGRPGRAGGAGGTGRAGGPGR
jgi:membrane-bound metal-dependent hydrolase YbcI (DUF457 family)